jgi:hypothetical protein
MPWRMATTSAWAILMAVVEGSSQDGKWWMAEEGLGKEEVLLLKEFGSN